MGVVCRPHRAAESFVGKFKSHRTKGHHGSAAFYLIDLGLFNIISATVYYNRLCFFSGKGLFLCVFLAAFSKRGDNLQMETKA